MGESHMVVCSGCGHHFRMTSGPGMKFLVLHCDKCGRDKGIGFDAFGATLEQTTEGVGPYNLEQARDMEWPAGDQVPAGCATPTRGGDRWAVPLWRGLYVGRPRTLPRLQLRPIRG